MSNPTTPVKVTAATAWLDQVHAALRNEPLAVVAAVVAADHWVERGGTLGDVSEADARERLAAMRADGRLYCWHGTVDWTPAGAPTRQHLVAL